MELGIGTYTYGWNIGVEGALPPERMDETRLIGEARRAGIHLIQVGDNLPLHTFTTERLRAFSDDLLRNNLVIELGAREMTRQHLKRYILLCAGMKASVLRFLVDGKDFKPGLKEIEQIVRSRMSLLRDNGIKLALENHDRLKAVELLSLIENLGCDNVGVCLDTVNSLGMGEGIGSVAEILAPYTFNLHIKDFTISRLPHQMGFLVEGCPAGKGLLNIPVLLRTLKKYGKCRTAILEQWTVPEDSTEQTVEKEKEWAAESIKYLKALFKTQNI